MDAEEEAKRQKVVHLTPAEQCRQRPDMYVGSLAPRELVLPVFGDGAPATRAAVTTRLGFVSLLNELVTNALDNLHRPGEMRSIAVSWDGDCFAVENDGAALSTTEEVAGQPAALVAFGWMHSGTNFDQDDTGKKANKYTAGRNGVGAKGCLVFCASFAVSVFNAAERKALTVAWDGGYASPPSVTRAAYKRKTNLTRVRWRPDFSVLGTEAGGVPADMDVVCAWLAHNAALCAPAQVKVTYNGHAVKLRTPEHFARALGAVAPLASLTVRDDAGVETLRLCVGARADGADADADGEGLTHAFVNATPCPQGSHEALILRKACDVLEAKVKSKRGGADVRVTPAFVRKHAVVVAAVLVDNERFTDQTKRVLDTPVKDYGWKWCDADGAFARALERSPLLDRAIELARDKEESDAAKATTKRSTKGVSPKYEPALKRGTAAATLIVCEGDSAANLVRSGLTVVGRKDYGLYPLRGKFLNVRGVRPKDILENKEACELLRILGLQFGLVYDAAAVRKLPYRRLMVMSDQDVDGAHIAGLVYNFVDAVAPSLLAAHPRYLARFATALIRVSALKGEDDVAFYTQGEHDAWVAARVAAARPTGKASYFKGLGTSSAALAKEYFRDLGRNVIAMRHGGAECADALDLAFNKRRADDRKTFLLDCDPASHVDYAAEATTLAAFVRLELLPQYAMASVVRAIPSVVDGLKEALRKALYGARTLNLKEGLSVANAAGKIAALTKYHHRGTAMEDTLVGMAADYAGTSNVNLLLPLGQFGTRHKHAAASAAYPKVALNDPVQALLYRREDDALLPRVVDEGERVEPTRYVPVVAAVLLFGARGIATGWSTDVPQYHPVAVVDATLALLDGAALPELAPWYRGFGGRVVADGEGAFLVHGACAWEGDDLHVTEVPPFREVEAYKEDWSKFADEIVPGPDHTDERVHLVLRKCTAPRDAVDPLKMTKRVALTNMHLLDAEGRLVRYAHPHAVLRAHAEVRLAAYAARLAHDVAKCETDLVVADAKARFLTLSLDDAFVMRAHATVADAEAACRALALPEHPDEGGYLYLLRMESLALVRENLTRFRARADALRASLADLRARTPRDVWRAECAALRVHLVADPRYAVPASSASSAS